MTNRLNELRRRMAEAGIDAALLVHPRDIFYYAGTARPATLVVAPDDAALLVRRGLEYAREEAMIERVEAERARSTEMSAMRRRWVARTSPTLMLRLLDAMADRPELGPVGVSLARELLDLELDDALRQRAIAAASVLLRAAAERSLPTIHEHDWQRLVVAIANAGAVADAVDATMVLLLHVDETHAPSCSFLNQSTII